MFPPDNFLLPLVTFNAIKKNFFLIFYEGRAISRIHNNIIIIITPPRKRWVNTVVCHLKEQVSIPPSIEGRDMDTSGLLSRAVLTVGFHLFCCNRFLNSYIIEIQVS